MTLNLMVPGQDDLKPRITVFGVGGAGGNAVNNMIEQKLEGVEFVVANTDAQALQQSASTARVQMGVKVTEGLGAGARPTVGAAAAEETIEEIIDHLAGAHMCFITAGMGGGTGTGAAPIIAQAARELGVLTVGVVTKPFQFEGNKRMRQAEEGVEALQKVVDTLIIIPNQNLFRLANEQTTFTDAFAMADDVLYQGVKGVTDLMVRPGVINLDFADVRSVMDEMGKAMMGTGEAEGEGRAEQAAQKAIANPLLDEISLTGAKGVLINITGGSDLTLFELDEAANVIRDKVDQDANIIVGSTLDGSMEGRMRVSVVATGIDAVQVDLEHPVPRRSLAAPLPTTAIEAPQPVDAQPVVAAVVAPAPVAAPAAEAPQAPQEESFPAFVRSEPTAEPQVAADTWDMPPAAYRHDAPEQAPLEAVEEVAELPAQRVAPGTPTPEALARLQNAVNRSREAAPAESQPAPTEADVAGGKSGFKFGDLITRMAGHLPEMGERPAAQPMREQPPVTPAPVQPEQARPGPAFADEADADPEQERIEIPAFLRRQAN